MISHISRAHISRGTDWNMKHPKTDRKERKSPETTHFYCKTSRNHSLFTDTQLKSANIIFSRAKSLVPLVTIGMVATFQKSISMKIDTLNNSMTPISMVQLEFENFDILPKMLPQFGLKNWLFFNFNKIRQNE